MLRKNYFERNQRVFYESDGDKAMLDSLDKHHKTVAWMCWHRDWGTNTIASVMNCCFGYPETVSFAFLFSHWQKLTWVRIYLWSIRKIKAFVFSFGSIVLCVYVNSSNEKKQKINLTQINEVKWDRELNICSQTNSNVLIFQPMRKFLKYNQTPNSPTWLLFLLCKCVSVPSSIGFVCFSSNYKKKRFLLLRIQ